MVDMSEEELLQLGRDVATDPTCHDFMRQGRPLTKSRCTLPQYGTGVSSPSGFGVMAAAAAN